MNTLKTTIVSGLCLVAGLVTADVANGQAGPALVRPGGDLGRPLKIEGTVAKSTFYGPTRAKASYIQNRNEYRQFFSPGGMWSQKPNVFWTGGERVVAVATGQGKMAPTIMSVHQRGHTLIVTVMRTPLARHLGNRAAPFHAVKIKASQLRVRIGNVVIREFMLEPAHGQTTTDPLAVTSGPGLTLPSPTKPNQTKPQSGSKVIPIQGTVALERYKGPRTRKAALITSRNAYRQFFSPGGQWVQRPSVFWTGGEQVVAVSAGQGKPELKIVALAQRGATLTVTIEKRALPRFIGNGAAAYHAVKIKAADLLGPVTKVKVEVRKRQPQGKEIPIVATVARNRYKGPTDRKASFVASRNAYRQFFSPQGNWAKQTSVFWTGGERVVAISAGQGNAELTITRLRQVGSTLIATIEKHELPKFIGNGAAAYHTVKIRAADLSGPVTRVKVRVSKVHKAAARASAGDAQGLGGRLGGLE